MKPVSVLITPKRAGTSAYWAKQIFAALLTLAAFAIPSAKAQTFTVLHSFAGGPTDGQVPLGTLINVNGDLYGTTASGGLENCNVGCGVVFKVDKTGKETVLYRFTGGSDGSAPYAGVIMDGKGDLYGTTVVRGDLNCHFTEGCGVVFKLNRTGEETVLHSFTDRPDGAFPYAGLLRDAKGNLYGTTEQGGADKVGTVFKVDAQGTEAVLHSFDETDGATPAGGLIMDAKGNLYGTTEGCKGSCATVFKLSKSGKETVLYNFGFGGSATGRLVMDARGNLYGVAGVASNVVFKLDKAGHETVLHTFNGGSTDGAGVNGDLVMDSKGNLYGTTVRGGGTGCGGDGCGVIFKLDTGGTETLLYRFRGEADGGIPLAGLAMDAQGNLYGTTTVGGATGGVQTYGTVFKFTP